MKKLRAFRQVLPRHLTKSDSINFAKNSFSIISDEYMVLSLHLGYHLTTIESMCTQDSARNYIRFQHKGGGAIEERRARREKLLANVFTSMGFEAELTGDYLEAKVSYLTRTDLRDKLHLIGRLMMLTKQLDMALSSDDLTDWYAKDIKRTLGVGTGDQVEDKQESQS